MLVAKPSVKVHFYARFNFEFTLFIVLIFDTNYKKLPKNMQKLKNNFHLKPDIRKLSGI